MSKSRMSYSTVNSLSVFFTCAIYIYIGVFKRLSIGMTSSVLTQYDHSVSVHRIYSEKLLFSSGSHLGTNMGIFMLLPIGIA